MSTYLVGVRPSESMMTMTSNVMCSQVAGQAYLSVDGSTAGWAFQFWFFSFVALSAILFFFSSLLACTASVRRLSASLAPSKIVPFHAVRSEAIDSHGAALMFSPLSEAFRQSLYIFFWPLALRLPLHNSAYKSCFGKRLTSFQHVLPI